MNAGHTVAPSVSPLTVLLVDDHADSREMYAVALMLAGFHVVEAPNGENALERAATINPAVVVADLRLGVGMDGVELCQRLKRQVATRDTLMIVMTALTGDDIRQRAESVGCASVLSKPLAPDELVAAVREALKAADINARSH